VDERGETAARIEPALVDALLALAADAGRSILAIRAGRLDVRLKSDGSPASAADDAAETVILAGLSRLLPGVPVVSEERADMSGCSAATFLLVDPLDGTREFLAGSDEFTVNIALIVDGAPILGVVGAPALGLLWSGASGAGAARYPVARDASIGERTAIRARSWSARAPVAMVSRSHLDAQTSAFLARLPGVKTMPAGSALKFCRLAEGAADLYPRLARTSEWDIAAGHAVLAAAGGAVVSPDGKPLRYGASRGHCFVPAFVAFGDPKAARKVLTP
jgi:3'(2'), 5'-bisphosphate nucleotidase